MRKGDLLARSWARSLRVCRGSSSSDLSMSGGGLLRRVLLGMVVRCC